MANEKFYNQYISHGMQPFKMLLFDTKKFWMDKTVKILKAFILFSNILEDVFV